MRAIPILFMAVLATLPASAQEVGGYAGPTLGWFNTRFGSRLGLNAGVSFQRFDEHPNLRVDLRYVQRGGGCCPIHSLQAPVLYTTMLTATGYVFVGPALAIGYAYDQERIADLSAVGGFGLELYRTETKVIGCEAAYSVSLPLYHLSYYGFETVDDPLQGLSLNFILRL